MFKKDYQRSPQEKAQRAKMSIFARLAGCAYLVYIIVQLLKTPEANSPGSQATIIIAVVLIVLGAGVVVITVLDLLRGLKLGIFNAALYEDAANFPCNPEVDTAEGKADTAALAEHPEASTEADTADDAAEDSEEDAEDSAAGDDEEDS